jgi:hypothetical protein
MSSVTNKSNIPCTFCLFGLDPTSAIFCKLIVPNTCGDKRNGIVSELLYYNIR